LDRHGQKRTKYYKDNSEAVMRRNNARLMAMRIAGTPRQVDWLALSTEERAVYLESARGLIALGSDYHVATAAELAGVEKRGFVYVITNPAWPAHCKVGRAFDPLSRLRSFQTGSPERDYVLRYAVYFEDVQAAERLIHDTLADYRAEGEWFRILPSTAEHVLDYVGGYI
jgi:hypothetical protein